MQLPSFVFDFPACPACGAAMSLARRQPHPTLGATWERVTFECGKCGTAHTRALQPGPPPHAAPNEPADG
jgi:ribosomal protein S27AE